MLLPGVLLPGVVGLLLPGALLPGVVVLPLLEPVPLVLGEVVLLEPPLLPPDELEPDLLKYASHSARDTCPSLFLSTAEKLGALPDIMPEEPDEPLELPVALGDDLSALPEAPVEDEPELCAMDTPAIAKSAAAVAVPTSFNIIWRFLLHKD